MARNPAPPLLDDEHVDVGIGVGHDLIVRARADFNKDDVALRAIKQMVPDRNARFERRRFAGAQDALAAVFDQRRLAFEHEQKFILVLVPMAMRGRRAGLEARQVDAELRKPPRIAERPL